VQEYKKNLKNIGVSSNNKNGGWSFYTTQQL